MSEMSKAAFLRRFSHSRTSFSLIDRFSASPSAAPITFIVSFMPSMSSLKQHNIVT
uniref:Uncharacterized protein n=1 Tax=Arundo donax TaxID=35708 RepID=A0A0A9GZ62_ARUDO